ncbi:60S ribosomal protein L28-like [Dromiciops gliroides]|uniref:60S ribosomal protein L28-like n=1 Tax=Dromiciops gliroides TaxID=33562 RepID=UPI001CC40A1B|nr:60S ribosomal protein L28-like [Dromiciops gliroides]
MLADMQWMVLWICSSFLIKCNKQTDSIGSNNLKAQNSFQYNRLILQKMVGIESDAYGKDIVVVLKRWAGKRKPATSYVRTTIKKMPGPHSTSATNVRNIIHKNKY